MGEEEVAYICPKCGAEFDPSLFQFGIPFRCECGEIVRPEHVRAATEEARRREEEKKEEEAYRMLQRRADRIAFLIVATDYPRVDIEIETRNLRRLCDRLFPGKGELFRMVYEARFRRLWQQFREGA